LHHNLEGEETAGSSETDTCLSNYMVLHPRTEQKYLPFLHVSRTEKASRSAFMAASLHTNLMSEPE
jgi:hypothetical protein